MEEYTNRELGILLESLTKKVEEGFVGVHARQDKTNGNVLRNTTWRNRMIGALAVTELTALPVLIKLIFNLFN